MDEARVYTVRVWRQVEAFRASVRVVGGDEAELFTEPKQVTQFLEQACAPQPAAAPAPTPSTGSSP